MSQMSSQDSATRCLLKQTETAIEHLTGTLKNLLVEEATTTSQLERLRLQIKEVEQRQETLKGLISTTWASRKQMQVVASQLRCLLSPIKTLPTEVLIHIFNITIDTMHKGSQLIASRWKTPAVDKTSLLLAQVCMRWRQIFQRNALLWNYLEFRSSHRGLTIEQNGQLERFRHYARLGVSSQQTLFLPDLDQCQYSLLLEESSKFSTPFRALRIDVGSTRPNAWDATALSAKDVTIYRSRSFGITFLISLLRLASAITVYGNPPQWDGPPWARLHTLRLKDFCPNTPRSTISFTSESIVRLLNAAPFLTRLELDFKIDDETAVGQGNFNASHVNIQYISIHLCHYEAGKGIFGVRLDLPALQTLEFLSMKNKAASFEGDNSVLSPLSPEILILPRLDEHEVTVAAQVLLHLPSVNCLEMIGRNSGTLLTFIHSSYHTLPSMPPPLAPKLSNLRIEGTDVVGSTLLGFVQAKLKAKRAHMDRVSALEAIDMYDTPGVQPADWWKIQSLLEEGRTLNRDDPITQ